MKESPRLKLGGPSNSWVKACHKACSSFVSSHCSSSSSSGPLPSPSRYSVPLLLLSSGVDRFVEVGFQVSFARNFSLNVRHLLFPTAYHELLFEVDEVRGQAVDACLAFVAAHAAPAGGGGATPKDLFPGETVVVKCRVLDEEAARGRKSKADKWKRVAGAVAVGVAAAAAAVVFAGGGGKGRLLNR